MIHSLECIEIKMYIYIVYPTRVSPCNVTNDMEVLQSILYVHFH